jgi:hypothetical protein
MKKLEHFQLPLLCIYISGRAGEVVNDFRNLVERGQDLAMAITGLQMGEIPISEVLVCHFDFLRHDNS